MSDYVGRCDGAGCGKYTTLKGYKTRKRGYSIVLYLCPKCYAKMEARDG